MKRLEKVVNYLYCKVKTIEELLLNSFLKVGDNISSLINDVGYLTSLINAANTEIVVKDITDLLSLYPPNINNEIQLENKTYKFDSQNFDITGYTLLGHPDGTTLTGYSQNINCLKSTEDNISLIKTSGNLFIKHLEIQVTGANSEVININGGTGFEALDMFYCSFINCTKLGTLNNIRQLFWEAGFANNFSEGFLLQGDWLGGVTVKDTRCTGVISYIFKGDVNFTCSSIRSNISASLLTGSVAWDFDYNMFNNDASYQLEGGRYEGTGKMVSNFTTGDTTITKNSRKSFFKNNKGNLGENTFIGIEWIVTSQVETSLTFNVLTKLEGVVAYSNEVNFISSGNNTIIYNSNITQLFNIQGSIYLLGGANDIVDLYVRKWNNITSSYENIQIIRRLIVNSQAGEDVAEFNFFTSIELSFGDRIELWVVNLTDSSNVTMINTSKLKISEP